MYRHKTFTFSGGHGSSSKALTRVKKSESINCLPPLQSKKVLDQVRERNRYLHFSLRTEEAYLYWQQSWTSTIGNNRGQTAEPQLFSECNSKVQLKGVSNSKWSASFFSNGG